MKTFLILSGVRHFLDIHPALGGGHQHHFLRAAVHHHAHVELLANVGTLLDQQAAYLLPFGTRLVRHQVHAENLLREVAYLVQRSCDLHAAALAAAAGVDLRLHHPDLAAELLGCLDGLIDAESGEAARRGDAELAEDLLSLVLVDLHQACVFSLRYHFGYHFFTVSERVSSAWHWSS
jgi:hypothetical protein